MQKKTFVAGMEWKVRLHVMIINYGDEIFQFIFVGRESVYSEKFKYLEHKEI